MPADEARRLMKEWLLAGLDIPEDSPLGQTEHVRRVAVDGLPSRAEAQADEECVRRVVNLD